MRVTYILCVCVCVCVRVCVCVCVSSWFINKISSDKKRISKITVKISNEYISN